MLKLVLVFTPLVTLALWLLVRALRGRALSRYALNVTVALFLLGYLLVTASLGLFWVARMDLPAFDWHYLFGYAVVLLASVHVALQLPVLSAWLRKSLGRPPAHERGARRTRRALAITGLFGIAGLLAWWLGRRGRAPARLRVVSGVSSRAESAEPTEPAVPVEPVVERAGRTLDIASYLYEESSYSRAGLLRSVGLAPPRPDDVKPYAGFARTALPEPRPEAGTSLATALERRTSPGPAGAPASAPLNLQELADIAFHASGVTERSGLALRAAASSGALYPADLYVLARSITGLERGAYYYDPREHALVRIGSASALDAVAHASVSPAAFGALPWAFVLGATYDRTVSKYNIRSCRYLPLDAGHLATHLVLSARALGKSFVAETWFDDARLGRALALEPDVETSLLVLHGGETATLPPSRRNKALPGELGNGELTRLAQTLTSWELVEHPVRENRDVAARLPELRRGAATLELGAPAASSRDLFSVMRERRSFRAFARKSVSKDDIASVLAASSSSLRTVRGGAIVEPYLLVRAVAGLEPGAYRYDSQRAALESLARGDRSRDIERAGLDQELLGRAAFVIAWSFAPERLGRLDGARDFRSAGLATGFAGEVAYLTATARGLGICGVGAFYDDEVNAMLSANGAARVVYLMGVGARG